MNWTDALKIFSKISVWIALPAIVGVIAGNYFDRRFGTPQKFFLIAVGIAFLISLVGLAKVVLEESKRLEKLAPKEKPGSAEGKVKEIKKEDK